MHDAVLQRTHWKHCLYKVWYMHNMVCLRKIGIQEYSYFFYLKKNQLITKISLNEMCSFFVKIMNSSRLYYTFVYQYEYVEL